MEHPLVERLLDAVLDTAAWPDVLRMVANEFAADHVFAYLVSPDEVRPFASRDSEEIVRLLVADDWHKRNPRMVRGLQHARSGQFSLLTDWRLFDAEEIAKDPFEQEFAAKYDSVHYAGSFIPFSKGSFLTLSIERGRSKGAYAGAEEKRVAGFIDEAARSLRYALRAQAHLACRLVDSLSDCGVAHAWVDSRARLHHASPAFNGMIGRYLGVRNSRLVPLAGDPHQLHWLIAQAANGEHACATIRLENPSNPRDSAIVRAVPLRTGGAFVGASADVLLSVEAVAVGEDPSHLLKSRFGLTPAEVRLVAQLNEGRTLRQAADLESVSYETARTRLKAIFHKTSVSRQAELIRLLGTLDR